MARDQVAIFPGSFDPLTNGHVDIIERTNKIFDKVVVAVLSNPEKKTLFSLEERTELLSTELRSFGSKVSVETFSGLLVDFVRSKNTNIIIRGLRAISDYDYEAQMALMNRALNPEIETLFLTTKEENSYISSTLVKQVARLGGSISKLVPPSIEKAVRAKYG